MSADMTDDDAEYTRACDTLSAAIEKALSELKGGTYLTNKWVVAVDAAVVEDNSRTFFLVFPPEQAPWDTKGLLDHGMDLTQEIE